MSLATNPHVIEGVIGNEGEALGNLSIAVALVDPTADADDPIGALIVVGSTSASEVNLGQFALTTKKATELILALNQACNQIEDARAKARSAVRS